MSRLSFRLLTMATLILACTDPTLPDDSPLCNAEGLPRWFEAPRVFSRGIGVTNDDCRGPTLCRHNENTDLHRWNGDLYLVHRTAVSQILGPNSSLHVFRSRDEGVSFEPVAVIPAVDERDIRDPIFYEADGSLFIKAITRIRGFTPRDQDVDSISVAFRTDDGENWEYTGAIGPERWGFWRVLPLGGKLYSAAYEDGDLQVALFSSTDGENWEKGAQIYGVAEDTPLETELVATPGGRMLALVRMDGTDENLEGNTGPLRTKTCWADPPFDHWECPSEIVGQRLDGANAFWREGRLFMLARKHLQPTLRKRTALFELVGDFEKGPLRAIDWGELPSASDTSYAGIVPIADDKYLVSWYSGDVAKDQPWIAGLLGETDVWTATFDPARMPSNPPTEATCPNPRKDPPPDPDPSDCTAIPGDPTAICGEPCDKGTANGVGEYCTTAEGQCADNSVATTCSDALNGQLTITSYVCTRICTAETDCGPGAVCDCFDFKSGGQICGCITEACSAKLGSDGTGGAGEGGGSAGGVAQEAVGLVGLAAPRADELVERGHSACAQSDTGFETVMS